MPNLVRILTATEEYLQDLLANNTVMLWGQYSSAHSEFWSKFCAKQNANLVLLTKYADCFAQNLSLATQDEQRIHPWLDLDLSTSADYLTAAYQKLTAEQQARLLAKHEVKPDSLSLEQVKEIFLAALNHYPVFYGSKTLDFSQEQNLANFTPDKDEKLNKILARLKQEQALAQGKELVASVSEPEADLSTASLESANLADQPISSWLEILQQNNPSCLVVFWPKSKDELRVLERNLSAALKQYYAQESATPLALNSILYVGENDSGVKSLPNYAVTPVLQLENLARSRLYLQEVETSASNAENFNLFGAKFSSGKDLPKFYQYSLGSGKAETSADLPVALPWLVNLPGCYGFNRIDQGSQLLLATYQDLNQPYNRYLKDLIYRLQTAGEERELNLLDYGCGDGFLSLNLYQHLFADINTNCNLDLFDANLTSLLISGFNFSMAKVNANLSLHLGTSLASSLKQGMTKRYYHEIVSNPPFHDGQGETYSITEQLIADAKSLLKANGRLRLVANSHLPYHQMLSDHFHKVEVIAQAKGFKVYLASTPKQSPQGRK